MFKDFSQAVHAQFSGMSQHELFVVDIDKDELYAAYLAAFPEGTNPIFRERTEHDCSCCRNFIKNLGAVVAIVDGQVHTVWDTAALYDGALAEEYKVVAGVLAAHVKGAPIKGLYRSSEKSYGAESSKELREDGTVHTWNHFHGKVAAMHFTGQVGKTVGDYGTAAGVFKRGLTELKESALDQIIELIEAKALYRGEEHLAIARAFRTLWLDYSARGHRPNPQAEQDIFVWTNTSHFAAKFRNTVIGSLAIDLSEGVDVEQAVKSFEKKVAPENYKRPTAIITPRMVEDAMKTIEAEGLEPALHRRFANIGDVSVNNVLWVDNAARSKMKDGIAGILMDAASSGMQVPTADKATPISIEDFLATIVPQATGIELVVKNNQQGNFMALTAPVHADVEPLFKWDNNFAWAYAGGNADSELRRRVESAGGRVDGVLRFSHTWNYAARNASLMDLHVFLPGSSSHREGSHDNYPSGQRVGWNNRNDPTSGGIQDVDFTEAAKEGYAPVENITFPSMDRLRDGTYTFKIHNWKLRDPTKGGFRAEIEFDGQTFQYERTEPLANKEWVTVATATLKDGQFTIEHRMPTTTTPQLKWGVKTEQPVKVRTIMHSPNYWDENAVGNRHVFFILDGCQADAPVRGLFNEYLNAKLDKHRKVFETLGSKLQCQPTDDQLAGVGFSSTRGDKVLVNVTGPKLRKSYLINF